MPRERMLMWSGMLPRDLFAALQRRARSEDAPVAAIVRRAIAIYLTNATPGIRRAPETKRSLLTRDA